MEGAFGIAKVGSQIKSVGQQTVQGARALKEDLSDAMEHSYIKQAPHDISQGLSQMRDNWNKDVNRDTIGAVWGKFKANLSEVFGNAKENIKNKRYSNIFEPPQQGQVRPSQQPSKSPEDVPAESSKPSLSPPPVTLQSQVYQFDSLELNEEER